MKLVTLLTLFTLAGCVATPVKRNFPEVPEELKTECPALVQIPAGATLSEVVSSVSVNYSQYHECKVKMDAWNKWYTSQKEIFESVK